MSRESQEQFIIRQDDFYETAQPTTTGSYRKVAIIYLTTKNGKAAFVEVIPGSKYS